MTGIPFLIVFLYKEYLIFQAAPLFFLDKFWGIRSRTFYQHCVGSFSCICGCFVPICFPILCRTMAPVSVSIRFGEKSFSGMPSFLLLISMGAITNICTEQRGRKQSCHVSVQILKPVRVFFLSLYIIRFTFL